MQRLVITVLLIFASIGVLLSLIAGDGPDPAPVDDAQTVEEAPALDEGRAEPAAPVAEDEPAAPAPDAPAPPPDEEVADEAEFAPLSGLRVRTVEEAQPEPTVGSTDPDEDVNPYMFEASFTPYGAGVRYIYLSRFSTTVDEHDPYPIQQRQFIEYRVIDGENRRTFRYPLAAHSIVVNDQRVFLFHQRWEVDPEATDDEQATFFLTLVDENDDPVLRITRTWQIDPESYDVRLGQRLENLTGQPLRVHFSQYGPLDMFQEPGYIGDQRHIVMGYLQPQRARPEVKYPTTSDFYLSRRRVLGEAQPEIWPELDGDPGRELLWAAMTNRYFASALYIPPREDNGFVLRPLDRLYPSIQRETWGPADSPTMGLLLASTPIELAPEAGANMNTRLYAGPKKPEVLKAEGTAYDALAMGELIRYNLGGPCAALTFAWLAEGLLAFLTFIYSLLRDWGVAIILLVAVVRLVLHPLTRRTQINMLKMGKQMQSLQPEIERIKKKFGDDQKRQQQEMLKLYQEKGVNPFAMGLGCLPMLIQMPIWIALYAMLYFAIELRHSPAFWGVFQVISNDAWPFLADLSMQDRFIPLPDVPLIFGFTLSGINLLPLLMMVVFYFQQKFMTPPPSPHMTEEQLMQQKMMRWMIMLFPIILYLAPSGLNLYILVSTSVGIVESMRVRKHVNELEEQGKLFEKKKPKEGGLMQRLQQAAEQQQKAMEEKKAEKAGAGGGGGKKKGKKKKRA